MAITQYLNRTLFPKIKYPKKNLQYLYFPIPTTNFFYAKKITKKVSIYLFLNRCIIILLTLKKNRVRKRMPRIQRQVLSSEDESQSKTINLILCTFHQKIYTAKCKIGRDELQYLIKHVDLSIVKEFWLDHNYIDGRQLSLISKSRLPSLVELHLNKNFIGYYGARSIVAIEMPYLAYLYINQNYLGNEGIRTLTKSWWPKLKSLNIGNNDITQDGLSKLQQAHWRQLKYLELVNNQMQAAGAVNLASCQFPSIKRICLPRNVEFVNQPPYLLPTNQEFEDGVIAALPDSWGLEFTMD